MNEPQYMQECRDMGLCGFIWHGHSFPKHICGEPIHHESDHICINAHMCSPLGEHNTSIRMEELERKRISE